MAAQKSKVTYTDGREVVVQLTPKAIVVTESKYNGIGPHNQVTSSMHMVWASLHQAGMESADFDTWLDNVAEVEDVQGPVDPTPPAPSLVKPSDSAS